MGPGGFSVGVDFMPLSLRRCQPGQVPRDSLNPVFRGTPSGHEKHKWAGLHRKLGSPTAAPTACSYCALLCGENECVGFSECEFGVLGGHIHERQAERSVGRRYGNTDQSPHGGVARHPLQEDPVLPVQLVATTLEREVWRKAWPELRGYNPCLYVFEPRLVLDDQAVCRILNYIVKIPLEIPERTQFCSDVDSAFPNGSYRTSLLYLIL